MSKDIFDNAVEELTKWINKKIADSVMLHFTDPKAYHKREIEYLTTCIKECEKENEQYLKLCPNSTRRHYEPLYGDAHCITYEDALEKNKKKIQKLKKQIAENKRELEKLKKKKWNKAINSYF